MTKLRFGLAAAIALASATGGAQAANIAFIEFDQGWVTDDGEQSIFPFNMNIYTGKTNSGEINRSFFLFDISGLSGAVTGGSFSVPANGFLYTDTGTETVRFYDVSEAEMVSLAASGSDPGDILGQDAFADLGSGVSYGEFTVVGEDNSPMPTVSLTFSAALIADLNQAIADGDESFAIGAALTTIGVSAVARQAFWSRSNRPEGGTTLYIEYDPAAAIPLPATLPLLAGAFAALGFAAKRKKRG